jgi:hypothetical protein
MKRETLKKVIDNIIINQSGLEKTFFSSKSNNGEDIIMTKELLQDPLDWYEVLSEIERKCKILVNDELLIKPNITYGEFVDVFYNEMNRELKKYI